MAEDVADVAAKEVKLPAFAPGGSSHEWHIEKVNVIGNGSDGIDIISGAVINCTATHNGARGIVGDFGTMTGNIAFADHGDGISVNFGVVSGNVSRSNGGDGIFAMSIH